MATIKSRLERLEKIIGPRRIMVYPLAHSTTPAALVPIARGCAYGVKEADAAWLWRYPDGRCTYDFSHLTQEELEDLINTASVPSRFEDLPPIVRREMLEYIRAGDVDYATLRDEFNEQIARRAFDLAGVTPHDD